MDSFSQASLGAAVGEMVLGRKVGNKAILWGAVAGTLPDLDVLAYPLMDHVAQLGWHRGPSHAFFYVTVAAPILAWLITRIHRCSEANWRQWTLLIYLAFVTHLLLDTFTIYGTQLFRPFSRWPVAFDTISIIDPLYTVPLMVAVIVALFLRQTSYRRQAVVIAGLVLSTLYLTWTVAVKLHINEVARTNFERHGITAKRFITTPTIFNTVLWRLTAESDDGFYVGYHSLLDKNDQVTFDYLPKNDSLLAPLANTDAVSQLRWFSRGYYIVRDMDGTIRVADIRFGTIDAGQPESRRFIFDWRLEKTPERPGRGRIIQTDFPEIDMGAALNRLWTRIRGR